MHHEDVVEATFRGHARSAARRAFEKLLKAYHRAGGGVAHDRDDTIAVNVVVQYRRADGAEVVCCRTDFWPVSDVDGFDAEEFVQRTAARTAQSPEVRQGGFSPATAVVRDWSVFGGRPLFRKPDGAPEGVCPPE
jgi:hypothetical protein